MNESSTLRIELLDRTLYVPVSDAIIKIYDVSGTDNLLFETTTDENGVAEVSDIPTPDKSLSEAPSDKQPYSLYNLEVTADGYVTFIISGVQMFSDVKAIQQVPMISSDGTNTPAPVVIDAHTLWKQYPPKIAENEVKDISETGEIVLSRVVIPETIVVHDGAPTDNTAQNYYVPYKTYIKNVASNEIYSTWPEAAITANILAIMSFTLNRVYTEWYRSRGYDFTITSNTAYDQKWIYGKTIYTNISNIVDSIFSNYLSKPNVKQPLFTQYCDGKRVNCPNWMSQWGSRDLAVRGLSAIEILRYYYGNEIYINSTDQISGIPYSYPGSPLSNGSRGEKVTELQRQLIRIRQNYPALPALTADGIYGPATENAVSSFQRIFDLPVTGITDYATWYKVSQIYVGVTKIAETF